MDGLVWQLGFSETCKLSEYMYTQVLKGHVATQSPSAEKICCVTEDHAEREKWTMFALVVRNLHIIQQINATTILNNVLQLT